MKRLSKITAALLAVMISAGSTGMYAMAHKDSAAKKAEEDNHNQPVNEESSSVSTSSDGNIEKSETVYVITDAEGNTVAVIENDKASSDGAQQSISYTGAATTLTITFNGTSYLHSLTVANV